MSGIQVGRYFECSEEYLYRTALERAGISEAVAYFAAPWRAKGTPPADNDNSTDRLDTHDHQPKSPDEMGDDA